MKIIRKITAIMLTLLIIITSCNFVYARTTDSIETAYMGKSGKYIYYFVHEYGDEDGIMKYNIKTKKNKLILSSKLNGEKTDGIRALEVKGKYIYFAWNTEKQFSYPEKAYIYRMTKDGENIEKLASGSDMTIKGKRIYYYKHKTITVKGKKYTENTYKIYSMKLDGSDKKREKKVKFKAKTACIHGIGYNYMDKGKYRYVITNKRIYRFNKKTNKRKTIMKLKKNEEGTRFSMHKDYMLVITFTKKHICIYIVKVNGEGLTRIRKSKPGI